MGAAPRHRGAGRGGGRRLPPVPQVPQHGRVRLRPPVGFLRRADGHPVLPQDARGRALHAGGGLAFPHRARRRPPRARRPAGPGAGGGLPQQRAVVDPHQLLLRRRDGRAGATRLHPKDRAPVPLAEPRLRDLRRLPGSVSERAPQQDQAGAAGAGQAGHPHPRAGLRRADAGGTTHPVRPVQAPHRPPLLRQPVPERAFLRRAAEAALPVPLPHRGPTRRPDHRRDLQPPGTRRPLRPLLGRLRGTPLPALQRVLLRRHRALHPLLPGPFRGRRRRQLQEPARPGTRQDLQRPLHPRPPLP